jgi:transcriptional repressor NrdR
VQCPYCSSDSSVTETRVVNDGLRRRRVCSACKRRFTTYEKVGAPGLRVQKRDGSIEPFEIDKLIRAIERIGRRRPNVKADDARRLARDIEANLVDSGLKLVGWQYIVSATLMRLRAIDAVAASRLAANYVDEFGELKLDVDSAGQAQPQLGLPGVDEP